MILRAMFPVALVAIGLFTAGGDGFAELADGPLHVRVVWTTDPQHTATVSWTTRDEGAELRVIHAPTREALGGDDTKVVTPHRSGVFSGGSEDEPSVAYHHARITGLEPSSTCWFQVESDGERSSPRWFVTAPAKDRPFAVLSGGDSRSDRETRRKMNERIGAIAAARPDVIALAHGGDYIVNGLDLGQWIGWLDDFEHTVTADGRTLPIVPTRGNHEGRGPLYDEVFDTPGGEQAADWFATMLSPEVLLVTLNSETAAGGEQLEFLEKTLTAHPDVRWSVVQYHRPLFPAVKSPGRAKPIWQPVFDAHAVDLVLESDGHVLKRTVPIKGDAMDPAGTVYIGEGGLGVRQRVPQTDRWFLQEPGFAAAAHHVWVVEFGKDAIGLEAIGLDGEVLDRSSIANVRRSR